MTLYNKTTTDKVYGDGDKYTVTLPASAQKGVRGAAVVLDRITNRALGKSWEQVLADKQSGDIEMVE